MTDCRSARLVLYLAFVTASSWAQQGLDSQGPDALRDSEPGSGGSAGGFAS